MLTVGLGSVKGWRRPPLSGNGKVGVAPGTTTLYIPYATSSDLRGGLGMDYEQDMWQTGRSWDALGDAFGASSPIPMALTPGSTLYVAPPPWYQNYGMMFGIAAAAGLGYYTWNKYYRKPKAA